MIRFACPHCKANLSFSDQTAGRPTRCTVCRGPVTVPDASLDDVELVDAPDREPLGRQPRPKPPRHSPPPSPSESTNPRKVLALVACITGGVLAVIGLAVFGSALSQDTTVRSFGGLEWERVHNTGMMHNRLVNVIIGLGLMLMGGLAEIAAILLWNGQGPRHSPGNAEEHTTPAKPPRA